MIIKGGEKLEAELNRIAKSLGQGGVLKVGFLEGATYPDGTPVALAAALNNFGTRTAPARPFFTNMVTDKSPEWPGRLEASLKATDYNTALSLQHMGAGIAADLQQSIFDTNSPPLSPITVMLRGMKSNDQDLVVTGKTVGEAARRVRDGETNYGASDKPLVESGHMANSVDYEVQTN